MASGCDVGWRNEQNRTALHLAAWNQRTKIAKLLLVNTYCDVNARDRFGDTPLMLSARRGHADILKVGIKGDRGHSPQISRIT